LQALERSHSGAIRTMPSVGIEPESQLKSARASGSQMYLLRHPRVARPRWGATAATCRSVPDRFIAPGARQIGRRPKLRRRHPTRPRWGRTAAARTRCPVAGQVVGPGATQIGRCPTRCPRPARLRRRTTAATYHPVSGPVIIGPGARQIGHRPKLRRRHPTSPRWGRTA